MEFDQLTIGSDDNMYLSIENDGRKLKPNQDGSYPLILGAVNTFNSRGEYYVEDGVESLLGSRGSFTLVVKGTSIESEVDHPGLKPGMSARDFIRRNLIIDSDNVCGIITDIWLKYTTIREPGADGNVILIYGNVKPHGKRADHLRKQFERGDNVAFSIRSFTLDTKNVYPKRKKLQKIITFDNVWKPGIRYADVNHTMSFSSESAQNISIDIGSEEGKALAHELRDIVERHRSTGVSTEAEDNALAFVADILECSKGGDCIIHKW